MDGSSLSALLRGDYQGDVFRPQGFEGMLFVVFSQQSEENIKHAFVVFSQQSEENIKHAFVVFSQQSGENIKHAFVVLSQQSGENIQRVFVVFSQQSGENILLYKNINCINLYMYEWRKMGQAQREALLRDRKQYRLPWHAPPHFGTEPGLYHITAACYGHAHILDTSARLSDFESLLVAGLADDGVAEIRAWVILPNHYHLLLETSLPGFGRWLHRLHNNTATRWNGQDNRRGRKVWHRYADRKIRGEVHYFRTLNYIHANPVKHGYVEKSREWPWSSYSRYEEEYGRYILVGGGSSILRMAMERDGTIDHLRFASMELQRGGLSAQCF
jgi:putative transposase